MLTDTAPVASAPLAPDPAWRSMFGSLVRRRRRQLGLTLRELVARVALSPSYLSLIENGKHDGMVSDDVVRRLGEVLEVDVDELRARQHLAQIPRELWWMVAALIEQAETSAR